MDEQREGGRPRAGRWRWSGVLIACAIVLPVVGVRAAFANDMVGFATGLGQALALAFLIILVVAVGYIIGAVLIETAVLRGFVQLGYWRAFGYVVLANVASAAVGLIWYLVAGSEGWKTAWVRHAAGPDVALLFLRSFLVTGAVEALALWALLAGRAGPTAAVKVAATGNAATYALAALLMDWLPL